MKPLYTPTEFINSKFNDKLPLECYQCGESFTTTKHQIKKALNPKTQSYSGKYCSRKCFGLGSTKTITVNCVECGLETDKLPKDIRKSKSGNLFCSKSCATIFNNKNKTHGTRRSKLEVWVEDQLKVLYPNLKIHFNRKDTIGSELDVYIPSLNVAFELNGIFHFEPIYGVDKLQQIQENDISKSKACHDLKIDLCTIDTSQQNYFKVKSSKKYLDIITQIINERLGV